MVSPLNIIQPPRRYKSTARKLISSSIQRPFRLKKKRVVQKKTAADKREAAEKRLNHRVTYQAARDAIVARLMTDAESLHAEFGGHTVQWYREDILQSARLKSETRAVSRWNAFLRAESQRHKEEGVSLKAHEISAAAKEKWQALSNEERLQITEPFMKDLEEHRTGVKYGRRNVSLESFSDARQSLLAMEKYMIALHARTGTEVIIMASRASSDSYLHPFATFTTDRAQDFTYNQFKLTLAEVASRFEAYVLSGVEGMVNKHMLSTIELRSKLKDLINGELEAIVGKVRMVYSGFAEKLTMQYGVVIENWPIERFRSPSELTRAEVNILLGAWASKTTYFRKMEKEEWDKWRENPMMDSAAGSAIIRAPNDDEADSPTAAAGDAPPDDATAGADSALPAPPNPTAPAPTFPGDATADADSALLPVPPNPSPTAGPASTFINMSGTITKKPRKRRADAGKKRGPRKDKLTAI
ncbi:hypothetical protein H0H92_001929 [Tricholoma furcatifolium]|nr:hypothetical protein H0H92_001929 [Tricholoma furcatifolium]